MRVVGDAAVVKVVAPGALPFPSGAVKMVVPTDRQLFRRGGGEWGVVVVGEHSDPETGEFASCHDLATGNRLSGPFVAAREALLSYRPGAGSGRRLGWEALVSGKDDLYRHFERLEALARELLADNLYARKYGFMACMSHDGYEVRPYLPYDYRLLVNPEPLAVQGGLALHAIPAPPKWLDRLSWRSTEESGFLVLGGHVLYGEYLYVEYTRRIGGKTVEAALITTYRPKATVTIMHPDHQHVTVELTDAAAYFAVHLG